MVKSKLQKNKENPRSKYWKTRADVLWGLIIHNIYDTCLINEDCSGRIEAHHLISRAITSTRHKVENGVGLCSLHHKFSNNLSAHGAPLAFSEWLQENEPDKWEWASENKYKSGKPDYEKAYGELIEYCIEHHIDV